ncbi:hypothetical protein PIB30_117534 [Stylosanthes scabra]|uniref:Protein FAR1-RELATED SEQUENCE n=1 Tax=Stylosanthes scabra TaxID=79078 RepID=A0ABU6QWF7_9FABA|nr:hypothetical protein [Stylosanthes scabra]
MTFHTLEDAFAFYKEYAKRVGFSTKIRNTNRCKETKEIKNQLITCNREGKWTSEIPCVEKTNPMCGVNCPARIYVHIVKKTLRWCILKVVLNHSHPCCPDESQMLPQHRELSMQVCRTIEINEEAGIKPNQTYKALVAASGGHNELGFIEKDVRNFITRDIRNVSEDQDANELGGYLYRMKEQNKDFFYEIALDGDNRIKNVFWADARSRAACEYFGDVVWFETTYNKNRYDLPFASFVGVNHHGYSILLGCAVMKNEDIESFKWLFGCWIRCMGGKAPKSIITDQCPSMPIAIQHCMPTTMHRWCIWHIMKKVPKKLNGFKAHVNIEQEMSQIVWSSMSSDIFERD